MAQPNQHPVAQPAAESSHVAVGKALGRPDRSCCVTTRAPALTTKGQRRSPTRSGRPRPFHESQVHGGRTPAEARTLIPGQSWDDAGRAEPSSADDTAENVLAIIAIIAVIWGGIAAILVLA